MNKKNAAEILRQIKENDVVLDIGGWFYPFNRANWVIDFMPYETRGKGGFMGATREYFSKGTWIQRDILGGKPLPFKDKEIDFVICSHTLEDIRDPISICSEICRIGKRGYIEVPSRISELSIGMENRHYAGHGHHRWLIEIHDGNIDFIFKPHFIHRYWKYHFSYNYGKRLKEEERVQWLFWEEKFNFQEKLFIDSGELNQYIESFVRSKHTYPQWRYQLERFKELVRSKLF